MQDQSVVRARPRWRGFAPAAVLGSLVIAGSLLGSGASAFFTDSATISANSFTTGTVDITASPATSAISFTNMVPGDSVTNPVTVANAGNNQLRYAISASATNTDSKGLKDQLALVIKTQDSGGGCSAFTGTQVYSGDLDGASGTILGNPAAGSQTGDRTLNNGASEVLCFRASLPSAAGNASQGAATTATFTFDSEQTANNP